MKLLYIDDTSFMVDPEDGKDTVVVISQRPGGEYFALPRTSTSASITRFGDWRVAKTVPKSLQAFLSGKVFEEELRPR